MSNASTEVERISTQHAVDKDLLDDVLTALAFHKKTSQQRVTADVTDRETLSADNVAINTQFRKFWEDMQANIDSIQTFLDDAVKRTEALDSYRVKLLFSEKRLKHQLQLRSGDSEEVEDLKFRLDGAVTKERRSQTVNKSLKEQLLSVRSDLDEYRQRLPLCAERFVADITDGFSGFLYNLDRHRKKLAEEQRKDIATAMKTYPKAIDDFLRSVYSKLSRPGSSS